MASIIDAFLQPAPIAENVADPRDLALIQAGNRNDQIQGLVTISQQRDNDLTRNNQYIEDYNRLSPSAFQALYGVGAYQEMVASQLRGNRVNRDANADRSFTEKLSDIGVGVGSGVVQGLGGIATLGLSAVSDKAAVKTAEFMGEVQDFTNSLQSDGLNRRRSVDAFRHELDRMDNENRYEEDRKTDGEFLASLRSFGRQALTGGKRLIEDPAMLEQGISEGAGSMVLGGPITKGVIKGASLLSNAARVSSAIEKAAFPTVIGAMEAGGAFSDTAQTVMAMSHDMLMEQSPRYRELVDTGMSHEDAKIELAARSGNIASGITFPVAALTGRLVEGLERAPVAAAIGRGPGSLAGNSAREFIEEAVQSGTGQLAGNIGQVASGANPDQSLIEGVGDAAIQGGIFGAGTAASIQGPSSALKQAAKAVGATVRHLDRKLTAAGESLQAKNEAASPVSAEQVAPAVAEVAADVPALVQDIQTLAAEAGASGPDVDAYVQKLVKAAIVQPDEIAGLSQNIKDTIEERAELLGRAPDRFETLLDMASIAGNESISPEDRLSAGMFILKNGRDNNKIFTEDLPEFLKNVPQDRPEYQHFERFDKILNKIKDVPAIRKAIKWAMDDARMPTQDLGEIDPVSNQGQQIINNAVDVAAYAPQAFNAEVAAQILFQADEGTIELTPERRQALRGATAFINNARLYEARMRLPEAGLVENAAAELQQELASTETADRNVLTKDAVKFVSRQIDTEGGAKAHQLSLRAHVAGINQAVLDGNRQALLDRVLTLSKFAQSHVNKLSAYNQAITKGDRARVPYQALSSTGEFYTNTRGVFYNPGTEASRKIAYQVHAEALSIGGLANDFARLYPDLGIQEIAIPELQSETPVAPTDIKKGSSTSPAAASVQATTSEPKDIVQEPELPLSSVEPELKSDKSPSKKEGMDANSKSNDRSRSMDNVDPTDQEIVTQPVENQSTAAKLIEAVVNGDDEIENRFGQKADEAAQPTLKTSEAFPSLVQPKGKNQFHKAFKLPKKPISRLVGSPSPTSDTYSQEFTSPIEMLGRALNNGRSLRDFIQGSIEKYDVTRKEAQAYQQLLLKGDVIVDRMNRRLQAVISEAKTYKNGQTRAPFQDQLDEDNDVVLRYQDLRALNIIEKTDKGYQYNQQLVEAAVIAALDWIVQEKGQSLPADKKDLARILAVSEADITEPMLERFNQGISVDVAKRSLAESVQKFWGVLSNDNARMAYTKGIPEALAAELLHGMSIDVDKQGKARNQDGLVFLDRIDFEKELGPKSRKLQRVIVSYRPVETQDQDGQVSAKMVFVRSKKIRDLLETAGNASRLLSDMALVKQDENEISIGEPIEKVDTAVLRQRAVKTSKQARKAIGNLQRTSHLPVMIMFDYAMALGEDAYISMMSGVPYKSGDLNKDHAALGMNINHHASVRGRWIGLQKDYRNVRRQMNEVRAYAQKKGIAADQAPSFYKYHLNRLGRLQMDGPSNPQTSKLARHIFLPTQSTVDLSKPGSKPYLQFMKTVAQGIGVKTETAKGTYAKSWEKVQTEALTNGGKYFPLVQALKEWLTNGQDSSMPEETINLLDRIQADPDIKLTDHGQYSLLELARYELARDSGADLTKFKTFNYLEADGKTNGIINSLMLFTSGPVNNAWLNMVGKGGVYFGEPGKTLNAHTDTSDVYQTVADDLANKMGDYADAFTKYPAVQQQFARFLRFMNALEINFEYDDSTQELTIKRGLTKSPLTKANYAAGIDSISQTVVDDLVATIYEKLTKAKAGGIGYGELIYGKDQEAQFQLDLDDFTNSYPGKTLEGKWFIKANKQPVNSNTVLEYTFTKGELDNLKLNVRKFLIEPLQEAIKNRVDSHTSAATSAMQKATQIQTVLMRPVFANEYAAKLAELKADPEKYDYHDGDLLSRKEEDEIIQKMMRFAPIVDTGTQRYMMSGGETSDLFGKIEVDVGNGQKVSVSLPDRLSRSLTGDLSSPAYIYGMTEAGVRAIPTMTVGSGDGQMMLNGMENEALATRSLPTFDGLHLPIDMIDEGSRLINEAVFKTWTDGKTPLRAVFDSYAAFMRENPLEALFPGRLEKADKAEPYMGADELRGLTDQQRYFIEEISKVHHNRRVVSEEFFLSLPAAHEMMQDLVRDLDNLSDDLDARRQLYAEASMSVDQMAGGEVGFTNEGALRFPENASDDLKVQILEERRQQILAELKAAKNKEADNRVVIEAPSKELLDKTMDQLPSEDWTGVRVAEGSNIPWLVRQISKTMAPAQKNMLKEAAKLLVKNRYTIAIGNKANLDAFEQAYNADRFVATDDYLGKTDPVSKIILINNLSTETISHELVHAATAEKVWNAYNNQEAVTQEDLNAVKRIEALMDQWLSQDFSLEDETIQGARSLAESAISKYLNQGNKAAAVNEFMAWVLSNQALGAVAKKTTVTNPIARIVKEALRALKSLIWGSSENGSLNGPNAFDDLLSNLRFNTRILMAMPSPIDLLKVDSNLVAMYQSASFGDNSRLTELRTRINRKVVALVRDSDDPITGRMKVERATRDAMEIADIFAYHFPGLGSMQAYSTFRDIQQMLMLESKLNPNSLLRIQELYNHTLEQLKTEGLIMPTGNDQQDEYDAGERMNLLTGVYGTWTDQMDRSTLMSSFLALAMTDEKFREILTRIETPKAEKIKAKGMDALLTNVGSASLDRLSVYLSGERSSDKNIVDALDHLVSHMIDSMGDQRSHIEQKIDRGADKLDTYIAEAIQAGSEKVLQKSRDMLSNSTNKVVKAGAALVNAAATVVNEEASNEALLGAVRWMNKSENAHTAREFLNDITGRTRENAPVFDMVSKVRSWVQQTRQRFREEIPEILVKQFKTRPNQEQQTAMFRSMGKTDLASLVQRHGVSDSLELLTDAQKLAATIQTLETGIRNVTGNRGARIIQKTRQLAVFMGTGQHGANLLSNAKAIAHLYGEQGLAQRAAQSQELIEQIDRLATLYAVSHLDQPVKDQMKTLFDNEQGGLEFVLSYLAKQRENELGKITTDMARNNHYKGYIPSEKQNEGALMIVSDRKHAHMVSRGFTRLGAYNGSSADRFLGSRSYYFSPVSGRAPYIQGVMQTVHLTASGVDPNNGYTVGELTAGRIDDPQAIQTIRLALRNQRQTTENLRAVYDDSGAVVAFERMVDPAMVSRLDHSTDLAQMMGVWDGRIAEEDMAQKYNRELVDRLHEIWEQGRRQRRTGEFVNLLNLGRDPDPVLAEAAELIPHYTMDYIHEKFGPSAFYIRRDMLNMAVGARQASVGDLFSKYTRWKPSVANRFKAIAMGLFDGHFFRKMGITGNDAYRLLIAGEQHLQEIVMSAKTMIVVKSVIVPAANIVSNMVQLLNRGVPLRDVLKGFASKTSEINTFIKNRAKEIELDAKLQAALGSNDVVTIRRLNAEIQVLKDGYRSMSIWPLIEAGEFSAISTGQVMAEDLAIADGKWSNFVEKLVNKIPNNGLRTAARYGMITRDTALFQGLARATQYGDFVAKAVLYDHLARTGRKKEAIPTVNETFVNYNLFAGRSRHYLESIGLIWFWSYKLRSIKEAAYMIRHNPLRSLLMAGLPTGSPIEDNFVTSFMDGRLDYSIGPTMGFNSFGLNPWINLTR